jgi:hypothetical protein
MKLLYDFYEIIAFQAGYIKKAMEACVHVLFSNFISLFSFQHL